MSDKIGKPTDMVCGEQAYRVDGISNHNDETFAEYIKLNWLSQSQAERIAAILNEGDQNSRVYHQARPHGHKLWRGMEELI